MRISDWSSDVCSSDLPAGHAASLSRLCGSLYLLAPYLVDRLCDHGRGHVLLLPEPRLCVRRGEEGGGQSVGRRCDDARMDAVEPAAVPPVQRTAAYRLTRSEEHTSEIQSQKRNLYTVFCLKKKK